jgi:hypothetical protein
VDLVQAKHNQLPDFKSETADSGKLISSLSNRWLVFDNKYDDFVPYYYAGYPRTTNISAWTDSRSEKYLLQFPTYPQLCLYVNNKLYYEFNKKGIACVSLAEIVKVENTRKLFITFYQPKGLLPFNKAWLVNSRVLMPFDSDNGLSKPVFKANAANFLPNFLLDEGAIIFIVILIALYIALKNFNPSQFYPIFQLSNYFSSEIEIYGSSTHRINNSFTLILLFVNILGISFITWLAAEQTLLPQMFQGLPYVEELGIGRLILLINFVLIGLGYIIVKFALINGTTALFSLYKLSSVHLYELLRFTTWLGIGVLILGLLTFGAGLFSVDQFIYIIEILILLLFVLRGVKVAILLSEWGSFQRIYLFSYLCATEILPMLLVIRQVLDYQAIAGAL